MSIDKETKEIIEKLLLRGNTLLGETCPVCGFPLIYIKDIGLKFCPKCKKYVITSEADLEKARSLGMKEDDMILTIEKKESKRREPPKDAIGELIYEILKLVRQGKYDEALIVAQIVKILSSI